MLIIKHIGCSIIPSQFCYPQLLLVKPITIFYFAFRFTSKCCRLSETYIFTWPPHEEQMEIQGLSLVQ